MVTAGVQTITSEICTVRFFKILTGARKDKKPLVDLLKSLALGKNYPLNFHDFVIDKNNYQLRELVCSGDVWTGCFGKLRKEAPHIVDKSGVEKPLALAVDDKLLEKSYFLYNATTNAMVWQVNNDAGGYGKFQEYLKMLSSSPCHILPIMDEGDLQDVLSGDVKEVVFSISQLNNAIIKQLGWNNDAMRLMSAAGAGSAKFSIKCPSAGKLRDKVVKPLIKQLAGSVAAKKRLSVRVDDQTDPIDIFMKPLKDHVEYKKIGHYPLSSSILSSLQMIYNSYQSRF